MRRIKFRKGMQRKFLDLVVGKLLCGSVRGILQFGFGMPYSTLKSYYVERRLLPEDFFDDLCFLARIEKRDLKFKILDRDWGQVLGGMKGKR